MVESNLDKYELSTDTAEPVELYRFRNGEAEYCYTSGQLDIFASPGGKGQVYRADYIEREAIRPHTGATSLGLKVTVSKDHAIARLFMGAPPLEPITLTIYRLHQQELKQIDTVFYGTVGQANFEGSKCNLTVKFENWLDRQIPRGRYQYTCTNNIYDRNCRLKMDDWKVDVTKALIREKKIFSLDFDNYEDGYFAGGCAYCEGQVRLIESHEGDYIMLRYPFSGIVVQQLTVTPGCGHLFKLCARRFQNEKNFTGCPYVPPTDPEKNPTGQGAYWMDSQVVQRDTDGFVGTISL